MNKVSHIKIDPVGGSNSTQTGQIVTPKEEAMLRVLDRLAKTSLALKWYAVVCNKSQQK